MDNLSLETPVFGFSDQSMKNYRSTWVMMRDHIKDKHIKVEYLTPLDMITTDYRNKMLVGISMFYNIDYTQFV